MKWNVMYNDALDKRMMKTFIVEAPSRDEAFDVADDEMWIRRLDGDAEKDGEWYIDKEPIEKGE